MSRILITGIGIISPLGETLDQNRRALRSGICGIQKGSAVPSRYADLLPFGVVKQNNEQLAQNLKAHEKGITRTALLALHAFKDALLDSALPEEIIRSSDTALIGANTVGGMCLTDEMYRDANLITTGSDYLASYDFASIHAYLQTRFHMKGVVNTINTACSSSANAIMYGARLIQQGHARRAIVGGCDSLAKFTINGFNALNILSPEICQPFDAGRRGLNLGEGAAYLILEKEEDIGTRKIYAQLSGYGNNNDAFHPSALSENGDGPYLAMQGALSHAKLSPRDIHFINAHGTGTENNDASESKAMLRLFETVPPFASTKSNIGHTLGASGAIEAVYSILNIYHQEIYPGLGFKQAIPELGLEPVQTLKTNKVEHVLSNSFGFGGNCTSLIFSRA